MRTVTPGSGCCPVSTTRPRRMVKRSGLNVAVTPF
jgi:hypothetical protein